MESKKEANTSKTQEEKANAELGSGLTIVYSVKRFRIYSLTELPLHTGMD